MDIPQPPEEPEVKNIIDKLANFVARNGIAFEKMTKDKQKNNPKFAFLFGGQHYNYYQYKLTTEQQILNQQRPNASSQQDAMMQQSIQNAPWQQSQGGFGGFPGGPPPQVPQGMPPRSMQPIPPWQQQRPPAPWQHPHMGRPPGIPQMMGPGGAPRGPSGNVMGGGDSSQPLNPEKELENEELEVQEKIKQSEENLQRQQEALQKQEKDEIEAAIQNELDQQRKKAAASNQISLDDFNGVLQPIIGSCTKDSIANGKTWILNNGLNQDKCNVIAQQILHRIADAKKSIKKDGGDDKKLFDTQLHLIYLINDVLHHASRKNLNNLSSAIETVIVPVFSITQSCANEQNQQRLNKLLGLWNKFNYFSSSTMNLLSDPAKALSDYQNGLENRFSQAVTSAKDKLRAQYEQYKQQHDEYAGHLKDEIAKKRQKFEQQQQQQQQHQQPTSDQHHQNNPPERVHDYHDQPYHGPGHHRRNEPMSDRPPWSEYHDQPEDEGEGYYDDYNQDYRSHEPNFDRRRPGMNFGPRPPHPDWRNDRMIDRQNWDQEGDPDEWREGPDRFDDRNQWGGRRGHPPGPGPRHPGPRHLGPRPRHPGPGPRHPGPGPAPGPGGMGNMPDDTSLIPKVPYYDLPAGLMAPLVNLEDMDYKELDPARIRLPPPVPPSDRLLAAIEAFYAPPSHERPRNAEGWEHNGLFEFFRAKVRAKRRAEQGGRDSRSRSRSHDRRSYSRDRSYSRSRSSSRSRSRSSRSRSRSNSRSPGRGRRPTPPSFGPAYYQHNVNADERLGDQNRGAQMMKKMGWGGAGLGSSEQGMQDPVKAGDVRDKYDQFKGLGMDMNDPYETYRKTRSYGYGPRARGKLD